MQGHPLIIVLLTVVPLIAMGGYVAVRVRAGKLPWGWFAGIALAVLSVLLYTQTNAVLQQLEALLSTRETALGRQAVETLISCIVATHIALFASVAGGFIGLVFHRPKHRLVQIQRGLFRGLLACSACFSAFWVWRQQQVVKNKWLSDAICGRLLDGIRSASEDDCDLDNGLLPSYNAALKRVDYDHDLI